MQFRLCQLFLQPDKSFYLFFVDISLILGGIHNLAGNDYSEKKDRLVQKKAW